MAYWLKQSTAVDIAIGPFLDEGDGTTAETGLTLTQPDIRLKKNGGAWAQKNAAQTLSHEENGWYELSLDTTDTGTLGILVIAVKESGALPVWHECMVLPANVWDSLFGADKLQVHADEITAGLITAASIAADAITDAKVASDVTIASVTGAVGSVTGAVGSVTGLTTAGIADAVWEEAIADHSGTAGSTAEQLSAAGAAGDPWATALPGAYSAGQAGKIIGDNINATVSSRASQTSVDDVPTNAELATALGTADDAVLTAISALETHGDSTWATADVSALATAVNLATVDTVVDAIKVKTDSLTFTVSGVLDSNVQYVNDLQVTGSGTTADPWGP
jgi:hypothetical protein